MMGRQSHARALRSFAQTLAIALPLGAGLGCLGDPMNLGDYTTQGKDPSGGSTMTVTGTASATAGSSEGTTGTSSGGTTTTTTGSTSSTGSTSGSSSSETDTTAGPDPNPGLLDVDGVEVSFLDLDIRYPGAPALELTDEMLGEPLEFSGHIHDTGEINLAYAHTYDDYRVQSTRLYVETPVFFDPMVTAFAHMETTITAVDEEAQDLNEVAIDSFELLDLAAAEAATQKGCTWVDENYALIDKSLFKDSDAWESAWMFFEIDPDLDLNALPYESTVSIERWDQKAGIVVTRCGQHELKDIMIGGSWLHYDVVFDMNAEEIVRVIVRHYSYFEE